MTNKRGNRKKDAGRGSPVKKIRKNLATAAQTPPLAGASSSVVPDEATEVAQGLRKTNHGIIFQLKLLMLFLIRGIRAGHTFRLGTEMEDLGGKFDDIIFQYEVDDGASNGGKRKVNRYLQAKHKQKESIKITAAQLFNETEGDFSLLKYFSSYCGILSRGDDIQDCIICTNISFDSDNLLRKGIQLITIKTTENIFKFRRHPIARYKIKIDPGHDFWGKLRQVNFEDTAAKLKRNATDQDINGFFDKLVFVVNTPNEVILGKLLTKEIGKHYKLNEADFQSDFILRNMLDWFKQKQSDFMTSEQGQQILKQGEQKLKSLRMTSASINYQMKLQETIEFNVVAIDEMKEKLKALLDSPKKIERIRTAFPKRIAVKVNAALKTLKNFERDDSYLVTSAKSLKTNSTSIKDAFKSETCHQLLVVVSEDRHAENDSYYENLIGINQMGLTNKKVIILCHDGVGTSDHLKFTDLSRNCKEKLLDREVLFQGTVQTVRRLTENGNREEVINDSSMEELLVGKKVVNIPLHDFVPAFDEELYIEREIILPFDDTFFDELVAETDCTREELLGKLKVTVKNNIEWFVDDIEKQELWNKIEKISEKRRQSTDSAWLDNRIPEKDLIPLEEWENRVVVVSDVAGTGKSTMLSNYYRKMRSEKPDNWIIKMDLVDHIGALHLFNSDNNVDQKLEAIKFFIENIPHVKESPFAQSLLRHRLQTGDRIVVMLDGFDEIDSQCQDKCISLIEAIRLTELNALYITTRPHLNRKLQDSLFQLAYTLRDFNQEDQINYLSGYWTKQLEVDVVTKVRSIATSIVDRLSKSLKGNERSFIGIPLQCHIVADCFESQVNDIVQKGCNLESLLQDVDSNLNLDTLYERLFMKKREIYRQEKAKVQKVDNHILHNSLEDQMECLEIYLRDLAVKTLVSDQTHIDCLLGKSKESEATIGRQHKKREEGSVCFGLLTLNRKGEYQFLHRTYPEYLMANYLYGGFRLDEDLRNKLLDEKPTRELIGSEILVGLQYQGVQLFIDCMLREIVNHEKWHVTWRVQTDRNFNFPSHFTDFTSEFYSVCIQKRSANPLMVAVERYHANIFELLSTFADLTLEKYKILLLMKPLFRHVDSGMPFVPDKRNLLAFFWERKLDGFQRLLGWHDEKHADYTTLIAKAIYVFAPYLSIQDPQSQSEKDLRKQKEFFSQLLKFMLRNRRPVEKYITRNTRWHKQYRNLYDDWHLVLTSFLRHEYYDSLLEPLVQLVLQTTSDSTLVQIVKQAFAEHKDVFEQPKVEKLFNVLIEMERTDVLAQLPREMIILAPEGFKFVYKYHQQCDRKKWLPEKDSDVMTQLNTMAFQGETTAVQDILGKVSEDLNSNVPETRKVAEDIVHYMTYRCGTNPYTLTYRAAVCGQEEMFRVMLQFVNEVLPYDELQTALISKNGFLHGAFWDAMRTGKIETLQLIMKAVKEILGPESQLNLVKSQRLVLIESTDFMINVLAKAMIENNPDDYKYFHDLIFHDERNISTLKSLDTQYLSGLMSVEGRENWMKRFLDAAIKFHNVFTLILIDVLFLSLYRCIVILNNEELQCFLTAITSNIDQPSRSISVWAKLVRGFCKFSPDFVPDLQKMFNYISNKLGERTVEKFILSDNGSLVEWVALRGYTEILDAMLAALPQADQEQLRQRLTNNVHQKMFEKFLSEIPMDWDRPQRYSNAVQVINNCLKNGSRGQLSKFANSVTSVYEIQKKKFSIWNTFNDTIFDNKFGSPEDLQELIEFIAEKLDVGDIEKLMLHDGIGKGPFFLRLILWKGIQFAREMIDILPANVREPLDIYLKTNGPIIIHKMFFSDAIETLLAKMRQLGRQYSINILQFYLDNGNEEQLAQFMETITSIHDVGSTKRSLWGTASLHTFTTDNTINEFLGCVSKKLGKNAVKKLVLHRENNELDVVIIYALRKSWADICIGMFNYLDDEGCDEVRHLVESLPSHTDVERYGQQLKDNWHEVVSNASLALNFSTIE